MRIHNNYTSQTFTSQNDIRKVSLETLDEFNQQFAKLKSPTKFFQDAENAKCSTKRELYRELGNIWDDKLKAMKSEYKKFRHKRYRTYPESMEKLGKLMLKYNVGNCGETNPYFKYMLAKKGISAESHTIKTYIANPPFPEQNKTKSHEYLRVRDPENANKAVAADTWLNTVEDPDVFEKHMLHYMDLDPEKKLIHFYHARNDDGYREFVANPNSEKNKINFFSRLLKSLNI